VDTLRRLAAEFPKQIYLPPLAITARPNTITLSCAALSMPTSRRRASRRDERRRGWSELRLA
jgi:hypothetical protein